MFSSSVVFLFLSLCVLTVVVLEVPVVHKEDHHGRQPFAGCGTGCSGPQDCGGNCTICRLGRCVGPGNCKSYCDPTQAPSFWCYNDYCGFCDPKTNSCRSDCNGACQTADQCANARCKVCYSFRCTSDCGAPCVDSSSCANPQGCSICLNGTCQIPTGCGAPCQGNFNCIRNTDGCTKCVRNRCVTGGCNSICYYDPDCQDQGNCTQCNGRFPDYGVCTAKCGGACLANRDCNGTLTNCGLCKAGKCVPSDVCGVACLNSVGCDGNCHRCIGGVCVKGATCGVACSVNTDCDQDDPRCMYCINSVCRAP